MKTSATFDIFIDIYHRSTVFNYVYMFMSRPRKESLHRNDMITVYWVVYYSDHLLITFSIRNGVCYIPRSLEISEIEKSIFRSDMVSCINVVQAITMHQITLFINDSILPNNFEISSVQFGIIIRFDYTYRSIVKEIMVIMET